MKKLSFITLPFLVIAIFAQPASARKLIEDDSGAAVMAPTPPQTPGVRAHRTVSHRAHYESDEQANEVRVPYKEADNGMDLRKLRRVGIGLQAAGTLGLGGAVLDLAFTPHWSVDAGFGGGSGFQAVKFEGKYVLAGDWLMPYMNFGFTRWSSTGNSGPITKTTPGLLADRLLSQDERSAGQFEKNLLYPGIGLQFMQLSGDWAGSSLYTELTVLMDLGTFVAAPTGSLGFLYYF
jgi:hypothetical protein